MICTIVKLGVALLCSCSDNHWLKNRNCVVFLVSPGVLKPNYLRKEGLEAMVVDSHLS